MPRLRDFSRYEGDYSTKAPLMLRAFLPDSLKEQTKHLQKAEKDFLKVLCYGKMV